MTIPQRPHATVEVLTGAPKIAAFLGVTQRQVYHWCATGLLPHFYIGRTICARVSGLEDWLKSHELKTNK